jgi:hypothetical protein
MIWRVFDKQRESERERERREGEGERERRESEGERERYTEKRQISRI